MSWVNRSKAKGSKTRSTSVQSRTEQYTYTGGDMGKTAKWKSHVTNGNLKNIPKDMNPAGSDCNAMYTHHGVSCTAFGHNRAMNTTKEKKG
jgi:hypothetical protein